MTVSLFSQQSCLYFIFDLQQLSGDLYWAHREHIQRKTRWPQNIIEAQKILNFNCTKQAYLGIKRQKWKLRHRLVNNRQGTNIQHHNKDMQIVPKRKILYYGLPSIYQPEQKKRILQHLHTLEKVPLWENLRLSSILVSPTININLCNLWNHVITEDCDHFIQNSSVQFKWLINVTCESLVEKNLITDGAANYHWYITFERCMKFYPFPSCGGSFWDIILYFPVHMHVWGIYIMSNKTDLSH